MNNKYKVLFIIYSLLLLLVGGFCFFQYLELEKVGKYANFIVVSKSEMKLTLFDYKGNAMFTAPCATGLNSGNKETKGDMKTPEGVFKVVDIQNSASWKHDFGDGKGFIEGAYGPKFIRLDVPGFSGIGIHGTNMPETIGTRSSEGCIRLKNHDVEKLSTLIYPPLVVVITPNRIDSTKIE